MCSNAKRIYRDSSDSFSGNTESFKNGNKSLKGSLRSRGNVNKICRGNSERFKNRKKFPKAANDVLANEKKIHRGMLRETRQQLRNYRGQICWTTVKSFNSSANNTWIAQPRSTWLSYFSGRNSNHREMPWEGRIRKCQWGNVLWLYCSSETNLWVDSFSS